MDTKYLLWVTRWRATTITNSAGILSITTKFSVSPYLSAVSSHIHLGYKRRIATRDYIKLGEPFACIIWIYNLLRMDGLWFTYNMDLCCQSRSLWCGRSTCNERPYRGHHTLTPSRNVLKNKSYFGAYVLTLSRTCTEAQTRGANAEMSEITTITWRYSSLARY